MRVVVSLVRSVTFIFYIVVFYFLTVSAAPRSSNNKPNPIPGVVTDAYIQSVCPKTINPTLCQRLLDQFKGKEIFPRILTTILANARIHAMKTAVNMQGLYTKIKDDKPKVKLMYRKCWEKYKNVINNQMVKANNFMHGGDVKSSMILTTQAMRESRSCYSGLGKLRDVPSDVLKDVKEFQGFCSIVLVMCDKTPSKGGGCTIL